MKNDGVRQLGLGMMKFPTNGKMYKHVPKHQWYFQW
jgi:hypothetical protein